MNNMISAIGDRRTRATHIWNLEEMCVKVVHVNEAIDTQDKSGNLPNIECGEKDEE